MQPLKVYLVGGAVRDKLLGLPIKDKDYVVVGSTPDEMLSKGFKPVGKDFPVFLHPKTNDEYALARVERKTAPGYHGFEFNTDASVTLEDDLSRRDLTMNAIALDESSGKIIDPYGGQSDIKNRILKHVSEAFSEDPVRILRVARFLTRFHHLGFLVHYETHQLMSSMVKSGEVDSLVSERIWQELKASLNQETPSAFIKCLKSCGALEKLFPEFECLFGVPQTKMWHPEIDTGIHVMMAMDQAKKLDNETAFAVFTHDLGKGITPDDVLPSHRGHEGAGVPLVENLCKRIKVPNNYRKLAKNVCRWHLHSHTAYELRASTIEKLFSRTSAYQQPKQFDKFLQACQADATGRVGIEFQAYPQADYLRKCLKAALKVDSHQLVSKGFEGKALGEALKIARASAIKKVKSEQAASA